jgi:hypothetical protein
MPKLASTTSASQLAATPPDLVKVSTNPLVVGGAQLHNWFFGTRTCHKIFGEEGGDEGVDDRFAAAGEEGLGATIMGRNAVIGPTTSGRAGGATIRRTIIRRSS